jgi:hypothetical protein
LKKSLFEEKGNEGRGEWYVIIIMEKETGIK